MVERSISCSYLWAGGSTLSSIARGLVTILTWRGGAADGWMDCLAMQEGQGRRKERGMEEEHNANQLSLSFSTYSFAALQPPCSVATQWRPSEGRCQGVGVVVRSVCRSLCCLHAIVFDFFTRFGSRETPESFVMLFLKTSAIL